MATVTSIRKVKKHLDVEIDGEILHVSYASFHANPIRSGQEIDLAAYRAFLSNDQFKPAMAYAGKLLAAKGYATDEIRKVLTRGGYLPETADLVVQKLTSLGFLDDKRFAETFAEVHRHQGHGPLRIRQDLRAKGISSGLIEEVLTSFAQEDDDHDNPAYQIALQAFGRKKPGEDRRKRDQRIINLLLRRGFPYEDARSALDRVYEEIGNEDTGEPDEDAQLQDAIHLVEKLLARTDEKHASQKILGALSRRGFPYGIARQALEKVQESLEDEE